MSRESKKRAMPTGTFETIFAPRPAEGFATDAIDRNDFSGYQIGIIHAWLRTVTALAFVLVPIFFVLDTFIAPDELLLRFGIYRAASTLLIGIQHLLIRATKPSRMSFLHGYFVSLQVGGVIVVMTAHLGGFESSYYAGLIMVIIGVNLLMPWKASHTAANSGLIIAMYTILNLLVHGIESGVSAANNLFFLIGPSIIAVAINNVRYRLIQTEFALLVQLKQARDSLWSEMELAKRVQVSLLPKRLDVAGYEIVVSLTAAREVGGDYYDVIETENGSRYVTIGDVAGHGLDSGLIMMMAQTAVMTVVKGKQDCVPTEVLRTANAVLRENIGRLGSNHYMTMSVLKLEDDYISVAGHHQDVLIYRRAEGRVEVVRTEGTWLGIVDNIDAFISNRDVRIATGDRLLLFSDGITEATSPNEELFGQSRLQEAFAALADVPTQEALDTIIAQVNDFQSGQADDMTLIVVERNRARYSV